MNLDWIAEDESNTIGHATKLQVDGITSYSPLHALSNRDLEIAQRVGLGNELKATNIISAGESISYQTFAGVGTNTTSTNELFKRISAKIVKGKINLAHIRIPEHYDNGVSLLPPNKVNEFQVAGIVGVQLEANSSFVIPPINQGIRDPGQFKSIYERTKVEVQTFRKPREIMGYIPTTKYLEIIPQMIDAYIKDGVKVFGVDFSSSPLNRWLLRSVVSNIRRSLKIKGKVGEKKDKMYYLHVFDITPSKKSPLPVSPITDILTHSYGVDSTSGVMWGGGKLVKGRLRYFNMQDYGAYQVDSLDSEGVRYDKNIVKGTPIEVYDKLRAHKNLGYKKECEIITGTINQDKVSGLAPYLLSKAKVQKQVKEALIDIQEIKSTS